MIDFVVTSRSSLGVGVSSEEHSPYAIPVAVKRWAGIDAAASERIALYADLNDDGTAFDMLADLTEADPQI